MYKQLKLLKTHAPTPTRVWSWWDLGFALQDIAGFGVHHDGSAQYTPQTNLIATSLAHPDPVVMHDIIRNVDREGNRGLQRLLHMATSQEDLLRRVREGAGVLGRTPVMVLFTPDLPDKFSAIHAMSIGMPGGSQASGIRRLDCQAGLGEHLRCGNRVFDLESGEILDEALRALASRETNRLKRIIIVESGRVSSERYARLSRDRR